MEQQQSSTAHAQDRLFMQYVLTQAGDARLSKIEARLDAIEKTRSEQHDSLASGVAWIILAACSALPVMCVALCIMTIHAESPSRIEIKSIIRVFLRPLLLWLDLPDYDKSMG